MAGIKGKLTRSSKGSQKTIYLSDVFGVWDQEGKLHMTSQIKGQEFHHSITPKDGLLYDTLRMLYDHGLREAAALEKEYAAELDRIHERLVKLQPRSRSAAIHSVQAMFQFTAPVDDDAANKILEDLRKRGALSIDKNDKLELTSKANNG
jgi:hypothetical protein